jgi:hypothetical protein
MEKNISKKNMALAMEVYEEDWDDAVEGSFEFIEGDYDEIGDREELVKEYVAKHKEAFAEYVKKRVSDFKRARGISDEDYKHRIDQAVWEFIMDAEDKDVIIEHAVEEDIIQIYEMAED